MKRITPLLVLALAVPWAQAAEPAKAPSYRCDMTLLLELGKDLNPAANPAHQAYVTRENTLRLPAGDKVDLGGDAKGGGNPLCKDEVWRYLRDSKKNLGSHLSDQVRALNVVAESFFQMDKQVEAARQRAREVYAAAQSIDLVGLSTKTVRFGFLQREAEVQEVAVKASNSDLDPVAYEKTLLSLVQADPKSEGVLPGELFQRYYNELVALRAKMRELSVAKSNDLGPDEGLKPEQLKTPKIMREAMKHIADCDFSLGDMEKGRKLNCWSDDKAHSSQHLGDLDLLSRDLLGSDFAQTTFLFQRAQDMVGGADGKRKLKTLLAQIAQLKEAARVKKMNLKILELNANIFRKIGENWEGGKGIDHLRAEWAAHPDPAWREKNKAIQEAIEAVDKMQSDLRYKDQVIAFDGQHGGKNFVHAYRERVPDLVNLQPDQVTAIADEVANSLLNDSPWSAKFKAAMAAITGAAPKKETPVAAPDKSPKKDQPKKGPQKDQPKKGPQKDQPKKGPQKDQPKEAAKTEPQVQPLPETSQSAIQRALETARNTYYNVVYGQPEALKRTRMERIAGIASEHAKTRVQIEEERKKALAAAEAERSAALQEVNGSPWWTADAKKSLQTQAQKKFDERIAAANQAAQTRLGSIPEAQDAVNFRGWAEQADREVAAAYDKEVLRLAALSLRTYRKNGWRHEALAAQTGTGRYLTDEIVQEYFDKNWSGDPAANPALKANLAACAQAHGFAPQQGDYRSRVKDSYGYAAPSDYSVVQKCVHAGLVGYINSQKGHRSAPGGGS